MFRYPSHMISNQNETDNDYMGCPHCGAIMSEEARFCRECGSSDADGWREDVDTAYDDFDYDDYIAAEFSVSEVNRQTPTIWRWVAIGLLVSFILFYILALR